MHVRYDDAACARAVAPARQSHTHEHARTHHSRSKMFVRDRVDALIDPGSAFLELSQERVFPCAAP